MYATWLVDVLRAAGLQVVEHDGWRTRGHGGFTDLRAVVWHHDASPPGDSPGVPAYMLSVWNRAGAQLWVDRRGVWHVLAAGVAYHAGTVRSGMPGNRTSLGVETDHTTGEAWPPALLTSLRIGTAAILRKLGKTPEVGLHFHKTICAPVGRKVDPDGLDLEAERRAVTAAPHRLGGVPATPPPPPAPRPSQPPLALVLDGKPGPKTYKALQAAVGRPSDGTMSRDDWRAVQRRVRVTPDGIMGPVSWRAVQRHVGASPVDGVPGPITWRAVQRALNARRF